MPHATSLRAAALALGLALTGLGLPVAAEPLPAPEGPVVLTVRGAISSTNGDDAAAFDMEMLRAVGERSFETSTIWTDGTHSFTGVSLDALLAAVGAEGTTIKATALNDYAVEIPVSDAIPDGPIIAYEMDGAQMSRRDKGPLWVIYPFDSTDSYRSETVYSRSIWQLDRIEILD
ncbi:molybdopterin-dependent oxidoreductase [Litorisediminicola beolgyonensis]|uniref:Molybdopterin-dependent oxidoreductase n=1 Tax=Litorisediminicola beolgyonensis TaxID=1173614 RepID=A0ABW3ZEM5_9RHOB